MALPAGVVTRTVSWGPAVDSLGRPQSGTLTFKQDRSLYHTVTGATLREQPFTVKIDPATGSIANQVLVATDQANLETGGVGSVPVTDWTWEIRERIVGLDEKVYYVNVPSGVGVLDLDSQIKLATPGGTITVPGGVSSVAGMTGTVSAEDLVAALEFESGAIPDPTSQPDGKFVRTSGGALVYADGPSGDGEPGADGKDWYEQWLEAGNTGTLAQALASLKGANGTPGAQGPPGGPGANGADGAPMAVRFAVDGVYPVRGDLAPKEWACPDTAPLAPGDPIAGDKVLVYDTTSTFS